MGVDWIIAEFDKLSKLIEASSKSVSDNLETFSGGGDFEFDDVPIEEANEEADSGAGDVEDAPIVKFLHKMLLDAFNMRASDLHFEPYEHHYRVRFRIDGELREIASPRSPSRTSWPRASRSSRAWTSRKSACPRMAG